jgi:hypothetical protein
MISIIAGVNFMNINFAKQFKYYGKIILITILVLNTILLITWGISSLRALPIEYLLEDAASLLGYDQFIGFLTPIGVVVLAAGIGAVLLLAVVKKKDINQGDRQIFMALVFLAGVSLFLLIDDLFLMHERVFTGWFQIGERRIFLAYGLIFAILFYVNRKGILSGPIIFLVISFLLFGASMASDLLTDKVSLNATMTNSMKMLEEAAKLGGYLFWTVFILMKARSLLVEEED